MASNVRAILLLVLGFLIVGCVDMTSDSTSTTTKPVDLQKPTMQISQSVDVRKASSEDCVSGGITYTTYLDLNINKILDEEDTIIQKDSVCNGANGADGKNGVNGANGTNGVDGKNGVGLAFKVVAADLESCPNGGSIILMASDPSNTGIYDVTLVNQQSMTICNGQNSQVPGYAPVEPIYACGETVAYKEVLLRLNNGKVLGSFSNDKAGAMTRLAFLPDGTFMNTDNSSCVFSLSTTADGKTRSISWGGQVQKSWSTQE